MKRKASLSTTNTSSHNYEDWLISLNQDLAWVSPLNLAPVP